MLASKDNTNEDQVVNSNNNDDEDHDNPNNSNNNSEVQEVSQKMIIVIHDVFAKKIICGLF